MFRHAGFLSLKIKVALITLALFLPSIWLLAYFNTDALQANIQRLLAQQQLFAARYIAADIDEELASRVGILSAVADSLPRSALDNAQQAQALLDHEKELSLMFSGGFFLASRDGTVLASYPVSIGRKGWNYGDRDFIQAVMKTGRPSVGRPVIGKIQKVPLISIAVPIRDGAGNTIAALVGTTLYNHSSYLNQVTRASVAGKGLAAIIAPQARMIVAATDARLFMQSLPPSGASAITDQLINNPKDTFVGFDAHGVETMGSSAPIPTAGWVVTITMPTEAAYRPINVAKWQVYGAATMLSLFVATVLWLSMRRMLAPLDSATGLFHRISSGETGLQPVEVRSNDEVGQLLAAFNQLQDRIRSNEQQLRENEEWYRRLFEDAADAMALADVDTGELLDLNKAMEDLVGWKKAELLGKPQKVLHPEPDQGSVSSSFEQHRSSPPGTTLPTQIITKDGRIRDVEIKAAPLYARGRKTLLGFIRDVTEHKLTEKELWQQRKFILQVIDNDPNLIFVKDARGKFLLVNQAMAAIYGMTPQEMIGRNNAEINPNAEEAARYAEDDRKVIATRRNAVLLEHFTFGGRERWFHTIKVPMEQPNGTVDVLGISVDITERKLAEEKLAESYNELQLLAAHLEAVREDEQKRIARELHDEMGGQLAALTMNVSRLAARLPAELAELSTEVASMAKLVSAVIQTMRRTVSELRPSMLDDVGLATAIEYYIQEFQKNTGIECVLINSLPEEEVPLDANRSTAIFRILQESLTNVAKHAQASQVNIVMKKRADSLILTVADNGKGFERRGQKTSSFGLLGIRERALMVGGRTKITSAAGKGTIVWVSVPMNPPVRIRERRRKNPASDAAN